MKTKLPNKSYLVMQLFLLLVCVLSTAQVGINTTTPDGILDVNSGTHGIVLPRIALTSTIVAAPVLNPQGGNLAIGTVVYNTNTSTSGLNDVSPGIYVWTGTEWFNKFTKKHAEIFKQTTDVRTRSNQGFEAITNLQNRTFIPEFSGVYKVEVSVNYGGGNILDISGDTDVVAQQGEFRFTFNGTDHFIPASAYSVDGSTNYYLIWEQASIVLYQTLTAGTSYSLDLDFDQFPAPGYINDGNSGNGRGFIGYDIPCSVEFVYIGE